MFLDLQLVPGHWVLSHRGLASRGFASDSQYQEKDLGLIHLELILRQIPIQTSRPNAAFKNPLFLDILKAHHSSRVILLPVTHDDELSLASTFKVISKVKPDLIFFELDPTREWMLHDPTCEFAVAFHLAKCFKTKYVLGDISLWDVDRLRLHIQSPKKMESLRTPGGYEAYQRVHLYFLFLFFINIFYF